MKPKPLKQCIKQELRRLFHSMDILSRRSLSQGGRRAKDVKVYSDIYQQLGIAWEFLGLQRRVRCRQRFSVRYPTTSANSWIYIVSIVYLF